MSLYRKTHFTENGELLCVNPIPAGYHAYLLYTTEDEKIVTCQDCFNKLRKRKEKAKTHQEKEPT